MTARKGKQQGFTLLEVLLAIIIFSVISVMSWQLLRGANQLSQRTEQQTEAFSRIQRLYQVLQRDLYQVVVTDPAASAITKDRQENFSYTTQDIFAALRQQADSGVKRVTWRLQDGVLQRESYLLQPDGKLILQSRIPFLDGVLAADWSVYDAGWLARWDTEQHPDLVALQLKLTDGSQWRWLFDTPAGSAQRVMADAIADDAPSATAPDTGVSAGNEP